MAVSNSLRVALRRKGLRAKDKEGLEQRGGRTRVEDSLGLRNLVGVEPKQEKWVVFKAREELPNSMDGIVQVRKTNVGLVRMRCF